MLLIHSLVKSNRAISYWPNQHSILGSSLINRTLFLNNRPTAIVFAVQFKIQLLQIDIGHRTTRAVFVCNCKVTGQAKTKTRTTMSRLSKLYLFAYNSLQAFGWAVSILRILSSYSQTKSTKGAYASAGELICLLQTSAFLEVVHGAIGVVPSGVLLPLMQWGGRTFVLLTVIRRNDEVQQLPSVLIAFVAWSLSEVIRYPYYALHSLGTCPSWITYLRYTAFIVLYPIGLIPGEMRTMYRALPYVKEKNLYEDFFAMFPFSYYDFLRALLVCYPFFWSKLYLHLFKQRSSKLSKPDKKKTS